MTTEMVLVFSLKIIPVWEIEQWAKHLILKRIVEHVLSRHLSLSKENIVVVVDQLDFSLLHGSGGNNLCEFFLFWSRMVYAYLINCRGAFEMINLQILYHTLEICLGHLMFYQSVCVLLKTFL